MSDEVTTPEPQPVDEAGAPVPVPEAPAAPEVNLYPEVETELETIEHDAEQGIRIAIADAQDLISRLQGHLNNNPPVPDGPNGPAK